MTLIFDFNLEYRYYDCLMKDVQDCISITMADPETIVELNSSPFMGFIFLKAFWKSIWRPNSITSSTRIRKQQILLNQFKANPEKILKYCQICDFSPDLQHPVPISYFQTLFVGLLGKFITSKEFPINPLGLIHIFQSFHQIRPVSVNEILDLSCKLERMTQTQKGIESDFSLEVRIKDELVWQGRSIFLTKSNKKRKKRKLIKDTIPFEKKEAIDVSCGMGRKYAVASGDYNPHHLFDIFAKLFGFKKAIAHGMWSIARVVASLEKFMGPLADEIKIDASFKRPIFMPASLALGFEQDKNQCINFELKDNLSGIPHLKGRLTTPGKESN